MANWVARMWNGWPGWVLVILLMGAYAWIEFVDLNDDLDEARNARVQREVSEKVAERLRAGSEARQSSLREGLKPENLTRPAD